MIFDVKNNCRDQLDSMMKLGEQEFAAHGEMDQSGQGLTWPHSLSSWTLVTFWQDHVSGKYEVWTCLANSLRK